MEGHKVQANTSGTRKKKRFTLISEGEDGRRKIKKGFLKARHAAMSRVSKRWTWDEERTVGGKNDVSTHGSRKAQNIFGEWGVTGCVCLEVKLLMVLAMVRRCGQGP